jgi:hypothetical protein
VGRPSGPDLSAVGKGPSATILVGPSREVLGRCAWALARANDPTPFWLDIREIGGHPDAGSPPDLGWLNADQLYIVAPTEVRPPSAVGPQVIARVIRSDEPDSAVAELSDFLRLPSPVQEMIGLHTAAVGRPAMVIANGDRVRHYWPEDELGVRPILDALLRHGVLPIFTVTPPAGAGRLAFDFVFDIRGTRPGDWRSGVLYCEKAPEGSAFRIGDSTPLADIPEFVTALEGRPLAESTRGRTG